MMPSEFTLAVGKTFAEVESAWRALETSGEGYVFQTRAWLTQWLELFGEGLEPCIVLVSDAQGAPLLLMPLAIEQRQGIRRLTFMGGPLTDYQAPLLAKNFASACPAARFDALWRDIERALPEYDVLMFERLPATVGEQANPLVCLDVQRHASSAHLVHLQLDFAAFLKRQRSAKSLGTERRKRRRLRERGDMQWRLAGSGEDTGAMLNTVFEQKSENYRALGVDDLFADPRYREFLRRLTHAHLADGLVHLSALALGDRLVATHWGLLWRGRLYYMLPTYARDDLARLSPGSALLHYLLEWCCENGVEVCDFTVGDEPYKLLWRDTELELYDLLLPASLRGRVQVVGQRVARYLKRTVKQSPGLFRLALALRRALAGRKR